MAYYRKKPVVIMALQWTDNFVPIRDFLGSAFVCWEEESNSIVVNTLGGETRAFPGDWIIRGTAGEFYPCEPDVFEAIYELVE